MRKSGVLDQKVRFRMELKQKIEDTKRYKVLLAVIYAFHVAYAITCGFYYCTSSEMSGVS